MANNSGNVTWLASGLPSGVSINASTGAISGTPTTADNYNVTVVAIDTAKRRATATISITVNGRTPEPPISDDVPSDPTWTKETQELVNGYKESGALKADGTIPDNAVTFTNTNPSAQTLSRTGTNQVSKGSNINPVDLVLEFPVDIWRVYINNVLAAWAYSPGVNATEDNDFVTFYPAEGSKGVDIIAESSTKATVTFDTNTMSSGSNEIAAAFVPDADKPTQEIGKSTLATVNVSSSDVPSTTPLGAGSSSGGCSAGLGAMVSAIAAAFFISKKRS